MKQAYKKVYEPHGYSWRKVELTGICLKVTGGPHEEDRHYYQTQVRLFGIPLGKNWIPKEDVKFFDSVVETLYECKCGDD